MVYNYVAISLVLAGPKIKFVTTTYANTRHQIQIVLTYLSKIIFHYTYYIEFDKPFTIVAGIILLHWSLSTE